MPRACSNGIELEYDAHGSPDGTPLLLIMGLRSPMTRWPDEFCALLAERGYYAIRFDNRDVGLSTKLDAAGRPDLRVILKALVEGRTPSVAYTLGDMAADTIGLLDALDIESAHLFGVSLGGMVAQTCAIEHPSRVRSLTSMMSSTGRPGLPGSSPEGQALLRRSPGRTTEEAIEQEVEARRLLTGPVMAFDEASARAAARAEVERCYYPIGGARQFAAVLASGSRHEALQKLDLPALVMHGDCDPLIDVAAGRDTAACIPGARYIEFPGLGHTLAPEVWDRVLDALQALTREADRGRGG